LIVYVALLVLLSLTLLGAHQALSGAGGPRSRAWVSLRVLLPSWRFFDRPTAPLVLSVRTASEAGVWSAFEPLLQATGGGLTTLLVNARGNLHLAYHQLSEQLVSDLSVLSTDDAEAARALVSYELVLALVRSSLAARATGTRFQFRLRSEARAGEPAQELMTSELHVL